MIVLRTIATGVWSHAGARATEWLGLIPLMGIGFSFLNDPEVIKETASFQVLLNWYSVETWSIIFAAIWVMRLIALIVNGSFPKFRHSPSIRFFVSCVAGLLWCAVTAVLHDAYMTTGGSPTAIYMYALPAAMELRNAYVSRIDMAITLGAVNVRTRQ